MSSQGPRNGLTHELALDGKTGIESSIAIRNVVSCFRGVKRTMEPEKVREIFRRLNEGGVHYALIGGLALAEYAPPRATEDVDVVVISQDAKKVRRLFPGCYQRGTAIAEIYDFEGTRLDVQPARRKSQEAVVRSAVDSSFEGERVKLATLRDLIFLKVWASCERTELAKKRQDQADITLLLDHNRDQVSADGLASIVRDLLAMAYTGEDAANYKRAVDWLNETLDGLEMGDRKVRAD